MGLAGYQMEAPFAPSLFVVIRKRMGQGVFEIFQGAIIDAMEKAKVKKKSPGQSGHSPSEQAPEDNDANAGGSYYY